ncbi:MAG: aldehyde dehydrogenase family protein [Siphonobacter sp.]
MENALLELGIFSENAGTHTGQRHWFTDFTRIHSYSPVDGALIGTVTSTHEEGYERVVQTAQQAYLKWRLWPAPKRGEIVRQIGDAFRKHKKALGMLVSYEMGKSLQEGLGEIQEMIDICDFAVGQSRQLYGLTIASERPAHRMMEQWHPLGIVGVISAFNFPVAVWAWNAMLAWICGDVVIWKPSEKTPLSALACQFLVASVFKVNNVPEGVSNLITGDSTVGQWLTADSRVALISATGSTHMGKAVAQTVAARLGKCILELGGNNAIIVSEHADLSLAIPGIVFGAVGTAGQRCTSTRRVFVHETNYEVLKEQLIKAYAQLRIGNPLEEGIHVGPLIDQTAVDAYLAAVEKIREAGGSFIVEPEVLSDYPTPYYVKPCIAEVRNDWKIVQQETFAPILYLIRYKHIEEAIALQNDVPQGLSSSIFTDHLREAELFVSAAGSDCGIANVNIGTSGAEIGGAFGGEKETGGGRESGSDAWKAYMRRQTNTINYSNVLPLAQGIKFMV